MHAATYCKLNSGEWGLRIRLGAKRPEPGDPVRAERRDGTASVFCIGRVLWMGNGVGFATIADEADEGPAGDDGPPPISGDRLSYADGVLSGFESDLRDHPFDGTHPWIGTVATKYGPATGCRVRGKTATVAFRMTGTEVRDGDLTAWHFVPCDPAAANGVRELTVFND